MAKLIHDAIAGSELVILPEAEAFHGSADARRPSSTGFCPALMCSGCEDGCCAHGHQYRLKAKDACVGAHAFCVSQLLNRLFDLRIKPLAAPRMVKNHGAYARIPELMM